MLLKKCQKIIKKLGLTKIFHFWVWKKSDTDTDLKLLDRLSNATVYAGTDNQELRLERVMTPR